MDTPSCSGYNSSFIKSEELKGAHLSQVHQAQNVTIKARYPFSVWVFKSVTQEYICKVFIFLIPLRGDTSYLWRAKL